MQFKALCNTGYILTRIPNQTLLAMKLTVLLIAVSLCVNAKGVAQKVTLTLKNAPLETVFNQVKLQTGFSFIWDDLLKTSTIDINEGCFHPGGIDHCLNGCFLTTRLSEDYCNKTGGKHILPVGNIEGDTNPTC